MRKLGIALVLIASLGLGSCGLGPVMAGEAVDDMVYDVVPGDAAPEFVVPFVGDLHKVDWSWQMFFPWYWIDQGD